MSDDLLPGAARRDRAARMLDLLRPAVEARVTAALGPAEADAFLARLDRRFLDAYVALEQVYGPRPEAARPGAPAHERSSAAGHDLHELLDGLLRLVTRAAAARRPELRRLDRRREIDPEWYLSEQMVGYVAYADRFAGSLTGVGERIDHLAELGVSYLHLLPLLAARPEPNDGGYAVADFRAVDPSLGSMDDLAGLADTLRTRGISLCVDLVVNHTAREHEWAQRAIRGDATYRDYYLLFPDRELPDRYERTLWEVFPHLAPGNFTWVEEAGAWAWTSFHDYQWDLNYRNPRVFAEMLDVILELANRGVEVIRLDAVPFLWKQLGTPCQNLPEAHAILQAWRALAAVAAPATVFKAEAIVEPGQLVQYLGLHAAPGGGRRHRPECQLAYHNQLMVLGWSAVAERDVHLMTQALSRMGQPPPTTTWVTYVRSHDDIGWAVTDEDAAAVGLGGYEHRRFLNDFYAGDFPLSFARGARFGVNEETGDARISGSAAALAGIEAALAQGADPARLVVGASSGADATGGEAAGGAGSDADGTRSRPGRAPADRHAVLDLARADDRLEAGIRRLLLLYGLAFSYGGVPLVWMGDELGLGNDRSFADEPGHADDNRWLHRPRFDPEVAARRHDPATVAGRVFAGIVRLARTRRRLPVLRGGAVVRPVWTDNPTVFAYVRDHPVHGRFLGLANVSEQAQTVAAWPLLDEVAFTAPVDALAGERLEPSSGRLRLAPLQNRWLVED